MSLFHSAGSATQTGQGLVPLSWQEIEAWVKCQALTDVLTPWELGVVRIMSEAYASEYAQAYDPKRPMPYSPRVDLSEVDRVAVADKLKNILSQFKKRK